jgi:hypothetical protein
MQSAVTQPRLSYAEAFAKRGLTLSLLPDGSRFTVEPREKIAPELRQQIIAQKDAILAELRAELRALQASRTQSDSSIDSLGKQANWSGSVRREIDEASAPLTRQNHTATARTGLAIGKSILAGTLKPSGIANINPKYADDRHRLNDLLDAWISLCEAADTAPYAVWNWDEDQPRPAEPYVYVFPELVHDRFYYRPMIRENGVAYFWVPGA